MAGKSVRTASFIRATLFEETFEQFAAKTPSIRGRLADFVDAKVQRPPKKFSNEHKLNPPFNEMSECHLASNTCLVFHDQDDVVTLLAVCNHDDLKGKRVKSLAKKIKNQT